MGILVNGAWRDEELSAATGKGGEFRRIDSQFRDRITADGSSGFKVEAGRYHPRPARRETHPLRD